MPSKYSNTLLSCIVGILMMSYGHGQVLRTSVTTCTALGAKYYFDVPSLTCMQCPGVQIPSTTDVGCTCPLNTISSYSISSSTNAPALQCSPCASPLVSTQAQSSCIACGTVGTISLPNISYAIIPANCSSATLALLPSGAPTTSGGYCSCPTGYALTDFNVTGDISASQGKYCLVCPFNTYIDAQNPYACLPCSDPRMRRDRFSGRCTCPDGMAEDSAIAAGTSTADASVVGLHVCVDAAAVQNQARPVRCPQFPPKLLPTA
jgi:hypothetical protein